MGIRPRCAAGEVPARWGLIMHFYPHNIGEFALETQGLSLAHVGAYMRLVDRYVSTEKPIKTEWVSLAFDAESEKVAREVLAAFFEPADGEDPGRSGWIHPRFAEEIAAYQARAAVNKANGKRGGRPRKAKETESVSGGFSGESEDEAKKSLTNNQETRTNKEEKKEKEKPQRFTPEELKSGEIDRQLYADWLVTRGKAPVTATAWQAVVREAEKAGMSLDAVLRLMIERGWRSFRADWRGVKDQAGAEGSGTSSTRSEKDLAAMTDEDFERITEEEWTKGLIKNANGTYRWP